MAEYTIDKIEYGGNIYKFQDNVSGYITTDNDTKNTAGSTDTSSKIFLIGATSQAANPQTYSHDTAYVGTDGCLYSGGAKVLTAHQTAVTSLTTTAGAHSTVSNATGATSIAIPTKTSHLTNDSGFITSYTDEKVKQTPLDGVNSIKGLLIGASTGSTETTSTVYTTDKIKWNDYSRNLYIYNIDGTKYSYLNFYNLQLADTESNYYGDIRINTLTAARRWYLPDKNGTIALTSDIPDVSGFITSDSDEKVKVAAGSTNTGYYPVLATGAGTATRQYLSTIQLLNSSSYGTEFILGKNDGTSQGLVQLWSKTSGYYVAISPQDTFTANRAIRLPDQDGIIALTKDLDNYLPLTGGTLTGPLTINSRLYVKNYSAIRLYENDGTSTGQLAYMGTDNELYLGDEDHVTHLRGSSIMLKDHTSSIGYTTSGSASLDSLTSGSSTQNARVNGTDYQISIPAGGWVITVEARFPSNANGIRGLAFRDSSGTTFSGTLVQVRPVSGGQTAIQTTLCANYSSDTHVKIGIFQTTGSAMTDISLYYRMIRIA